MKVWLTAAEIAHLGLPGLPGTKRNVNALAAAQGWARRPGLSRPRRQAGGGVEYHVDLLPAPARQAYVGRLIGDPAPAAAPAEPEPAGPVLRADAAEARDARLAILAAAERICAETGLPRRHADLRCVADYGAGRLGLPDWVRAQVPRLTLRSLQRWRAARTAGATARLAVDRGAARRGTGVLATAEDGAVRVAMLALIARQPHLSADHVRTLLLERFGETLAVTRSGGRRLRVPMPPVRTVQAALAAWRSAEKVALTALTNPDAFKSRYRASGANAAAGLTRLNELWQIDASPMDALCVDGRHSVYVAIDVYSRRLVLYVARTPRAEAVGLLLRKAILAWGVPERVKTDNGSDFTAKASERLFAHLGIERALSPAFTPEAKAFVERAIGTFQRDLGPLLPGFIGHSVADRKVIEARRAFAARLGQSDADAFCVSLTGPELQGYCDLWAEKRYQHRPHAGLGGATPYAVAAAAAGRLRRIADARALDMLLAPVAGRDGRRVVGKQGVLVEGSHYLAPAVLAGTEVLVRMDPADLGRAYLFAVAGGQFLGEATCPEILGVDPVAATAHAKAAQKALIDGATAAIRREARKIRPRDMADAVLGRAARSRDNLVAFPRPADGHATPALDAAAEAANPVPPPARPLDPAAHALQAEIEADLAGPAPAAAVRRLRVVDTPQARFRRALELRARIDRGEPVATADALWLGGYEAGPEHRAFRDLYEDFGEAALR
ncbi:DDE-type integrase/transposase/recombinase [Methylobacterium sp. J-070]|uniref:DDE-type integrase/transposase/recombinase n=1 Tax=Methylobacterium sp. J-070 TaxID=2836650 RepID=UPI001FB93114|nr:DDE-type integrase/transposase/recombinase [Methylobacterium sp. J-070]MCJ2050866.1 DDE-type integrase/transposase/recombinase [Methylobacterium sp. J-070]